MRDNFEEGWYFPAEDGPSGDSPFWNPYYRNDVGEWIEAQSEGHIPVEYPYQLVWPLREVATGIVHPDPESVTAVIADQLRDALPGVPVYTNVPERLDVQP